MATRTPTLPRSPKPDEPCALSCACGKLLARWVDGIRCQRCKRTVRIAVEPDGAYVRGDA